MSTSNSPRWISVAAAAAELGLAAVSLRRMIAAHADVGPDGTIEASFDGIRARKIGRTWRVLLSEPWNSAA